MEKSITVLLMPHAELLSSIDQELQDNPLLEAEFQKPPESNRINAFLDLPSSYTRQAPNDEEDEWESPLESMISLEDHLFQQLYLEVSGLVERKIGEYIIGNLDKDGFLTTSCEEIAKALMVDVPLVKAVLSTIQHFDPAGIAARDFKECLIIQLQNLPSSELAVRIINSHLDDVGNKRYALLAKKLGVGLDELMEAIKLITCLEPKPARNWQPVDPGIYVEPDLYVRQNAQGEFEVTANNNGLPVLKISQRYKSLLSSPGLSAQDRQFINEKINKALQFMKDLRQRGETLTAVGRYILENQKAFFSGQDNRLAPLTLKEAAQHLNRCESTISRAINHKYMDTPLGIFPLKFFFAHHASRRADSQVSAYTVQQQMAELIEEEDKKMPLSDHQIQEHFKSNGINLSRRTITKYRQVLDIPASHLRK